MHSSYGMISWKFDSIVGGTRKSSRLNQSGIGLNASTLGMGANMFAGSMGGHTGTVPMKFVG